MEQLVGAFVKFSFVWGLPVFIVLLVAAAYVDHRMGKGHRKGWPRTGPLRGAKVLLVLIQFVSVFILVTILGPLRETAAGARRIQRTLGEAAPDLAFRRVADDAELDLRQFDGKVRLVNLWATWCPPCLTEMPELDRLQQTYDDQGLAVITLSQQSRAELQAFAAEHSYSMTNVYAESIDWLEVGDSRPVTVLIDRQGMVRDFIFGMRDFEGFETMIRPYL